MNIAVWGKLDMNIGGIILSGGKSSRMGTNKSLLPLQNKTVIEHVSEALQTCCDTVGVVTNDMEQYAYLRLPMFRDRFVDKGPLAGLESGIYHMKADVYLVAACDMPFISSDIFRYLLNQLGSHDAVVPYFDNQLHPLSGVYHAGVLPAIQKQLQKDERKVKSFFKHINMLQLDTFPEFTQEELQKHFFNMNYPEQYEAAKFF